MTYSDELDAYQTYLEAVRAFPDNEELWEDLGRAKDALEVAYLENLAARALTAEPRQPPLLPPIF